MNLAALEMSPCKPPSSVIGAQLRLSLEARASLGHRHQFVRHQLGEVFIDEDITETLNIEDNNL